MFWKGAINLIKSLKSCTVKHVTRVLNDIAQKLKIKKEKNIQTRDKLKVER